MTDNPWKGFTVGETTHWKILPDGSIRPATPEEIAAPPKVVGHVTRVDSNSITVSYP